MSSQNQLDDALFQITTGALDAAIVQLESILGSEPDHFDARLALGMACYRQGDYQRAIAEGHRAEQLRPGEQLVHTNLSLFYMKAGNKTAAEHHGLQARIASWKTSSPGPVSEVSPQSPSPAAGDAVSTLPNAQPAPKSFKVGGPPAVQSWRDKPKIAAPAPPSTQQS